jgi:hypothetical protein
MKNWTLEGVKIMMPEDENGLMPDSKFKLPVEEII